MPCVMHGAMPILGLQHNREGPNHRRNHRAAMTTGKCGCERKPEPGAGKTDHRAVDGAVTAGPRCRRLSRGDQMLRKLTPAQIRIALIAVVCTAEFYTSYSEIFAVALGYVHKA